MPAPLAALGAKLAARMLLDRLFNSEFGRVLISVGVGVAVLILLVYGAVVGRFSAVGGYGGAVTRADNLSGDQMAIYEAGASYLDSLLYGESSGGSGTPDHLWMLARLVGRDASAANVGAFVCELAAYASYGSWPAMVDAWEADHAPASGTSLMDAALTESQRMWRDPERAAAFRAARSTSAYCDARWTGLGGCLAAEPRPHLTLGAAGEPVPQRGVICAAPDLAADWGGYDWNAPDGAASPQPPFAHLGTPQWDPRWRLQAGW